MQAAVMSTVTTTGNTGMKLAGFVVPKHEVRSTLFLLLVRSLDRFLGARRNAIGNSEERRQCRTGKDT